MPGILHGNSINYEILECVAQGQESIVYKAQVQSTKRCVALKFRLKGSIDKFRKHELYIFQALDHLNIIKIFDYIEDLGDLVLEGEIYGQSHTIDATNYFCVIEDFVTGEILEKNESSSLYNYCKQRAPKKEAKYEEVIKFQEEYIFKWILEFCDIMSHMTKENRILHLDIKPENIMVTRTGSIVLIDMGLSGFLELNSNGKNLQYDFDHTNKEPSNIEREYVMVGEEKVLSYVYGTPGFAAPECYYKDGNGCEQDTKLKNPFSSGRATQQDGIVDVRSDIFSFGCVLWDIIHLGGYGADDKKDYVKINKSETRDGYFNRDLHYASPYYLQELENIILKCTEEDPAKRFQDYEELKEATIKAKTRLPNSQENSRRDKSLRHSAVLVLMLTILLGVILRKGLGLRYEIVLENFKIAASQYSENTNPSDFRDVSLTLLNEAAKVGINTESIYKDILNVVNNDDKITYVEFSDILYKCLSNKKNDDDISLLYINTALKYPGGGNDLTTTSKFIESNYNGVDCEGYYIAAAIENCKKDPLESLAALEKYQDLSEYKSALNYLGRLLLTEETIVNRTDYREKVEAIISKNGGTKDE